MPSFHEIKDPQRSRHISQGWPRKATALVIVDKTIKGVRVNRAGCKCVTHLKLFLQNKSKSSVTPLPHNYNIYFLGVYWIWYPRSMCLPVMCDKLWKIYSKLYYHKILSILTEYYISQREVQRFEKHPASPWPTAWSCCHQCSLPNILSLLNQRKSKPLKKYSALRNL